MADSSLPNLTEDTNPGSDSLVYTVDNPAGTPVDRKVTLANLGKGITTEVVNDTTPQLGGNLDVNGNSIVSASAGNIAITPDTTGSVVIDGISHPQADGTAGQFLKTDGAGALSFADASSGAMARISGSTYSTIQHMQDIFHSAGISSGGGITDDTDGTITVAAGTGFIRATDSSVAQILFTDWAAESGANVTLADNDMSYVYVEYNAGSPRVIATTTKRTDLNTNIYLGSVYRSGTTLHITANTRVIVGDHALQMIERMKATMPFSRESGGVLSASGTRNIAVSAGTWWEGLTQFTTSAVDTSAAGTFTYYYRDGLGGWTAVASSTQINNTQYDDNSGTLATLSNNKYGVHWVYLTSDGSLYVLYGQGDYTLTEAQDSTSPASVPPHFDESHAKLIGRVIILKSASTFAQTDSAFATDFGGSQAADHGALAGLADDDHTQYSLLSSQAGAPSSTPARVGNVNVDTTADVPYISTDTASSADWDKVTTFAVTDVSTAGWVLDEDTMSSNSAVKVPTQQSTKAYADTKLANVVEDTTPQLGGQLDVNGNAIGDGTLELLKFSETVSAVNELTIGNAATGTDPTIAASGDDANIGITIAPKGTGDVTLGTMVFDGDQTIGAGQDNYVLTYDNAGGLISLEAAGGSGQTLYDYVLDSTGGGDYTDLSTALAAMSANESLFIRNGTYTEANLTCATAGISLTGESRTGVILDTTGTTTNWVFSGDNQTFKNLTIQQNVSAERFQHSGDYGNFENVKFTTTQGDQSCFEFTSSIHTTITGCQFVNTSAGTDPRPFYFAGSFMVITGCSFYFNVGSNDTTIGVIDIGGSNIVFSNNTVEQYGTTTTTGAPLISTTQYNTVISGNAFESSTYNSLGIYVGQDGASVTGNTIDGCGYGINVDSGSLYCSITGNSLYFANNTAGYGIQMLADYCTCTGNMLFGVTGGTSVGINVSTTGTYNTIVGNNIRSFDTGFSAGAGGNSNTIIGNVISGCTTAISDSGTSNLYLAATDSDPLNITA